MAAILSDSPPEMRGACSFCGGEATGYWTMDVRCCRACATNILPRLMVDATLGYLAAPIRRGGDPVSDLYAEGRRLAERVEGPIYRAVAALMRRRARREIEC